MKNNRTKVKCEEPVMSFNKFWKARLALLETED